MKTVPLGGAKAAGRVALVDDDDYDFVMQYHWSIQEKPGASPNARTRGPYARTRLPAPDGRFMVMHKLLSGWPLTDHIDYNGLNNQRSNLREATARQNCINARPFAGASQYKGVTWDNSQKKWRARISAEGKTRHLGLFRSEEDAACAYDTAVRKYFDSFAYLNFPDRAA